MTNILAIETSGAACSVALSCDGEITQIFEDAPREHARKILGMVDDILLQAGLSLNRIDALAYTKGPGSFTGLRIGFGIVQGLAFGCNLPVIGISTLQAMAYKAVSEFAINSGIVVPALDARMNEVYWAIYSVEAGNLPVALLEDSAMNPGDALSLMPTSISASVGDGWLRMDPSILSIEHFAASLPLDAKSVVAIADRLYLEKKMQEINAAELSYIRNEISWKKRERIRSTSGQSAQ